MFTDARHETRMSNPGAGRQAGAAGRAGLYLLGNTPPAEATECSPPRPSYQEGKEGRKDGRKGKKVEEGKSYDENGERKFFSRIKNGSVIRRIAS